MLTRVERLSGSEDRASRFHFDAPGNELGGGSVDDFDLRHFSRGERENECMGVVWHHLRYRFFSGILQVQAENLPEPRSKTAEIRRFSSGTVSDR